jgi:tRNA (adenine57-N1/adenine58-N1)-methyltransferase
LIVEETVRTAQPDDLALLVGRDRKSFIVRLEPGSQFHTHRGVVAHDDLIGAPWGAQLFTHLGYLFFLLQPSTDDFVRGLKRTTQIVYPKDIGYILLKMNIAPGCRVVEAGTGSGGLTLVFAQAVGPTGRVYSYEVRPEVQQLAHANLEQLGLAEFVEFKLRDIVEGFDERDANALFLDLPNPWDYLTYHEPSQSPDRRAARGRLWPDRSGRVAAPAVQGCARAPAADGPYGGSYWLPDLRASAYTIGGMSKIWGT